MSSQWVKDSDPLMVDPLMVMSSQWVKDSDPLMLDPLMLTP